MKITICASMVFQEKILDTKKELEHLGHIVFVSGFTERYTGLTGKEKEEHAIRHKIEEDAIHKHWEKIKKSDAILVLNYDRKGIKSYIGGNTLMEIGFAHVLNKKIFLLNPIPEIEYYKSEIKAVTPVIIKRDLLRIK